MRTCTSKEQETCDVEKRGCEGCYYYEDNIKIGEYARTVDGIIRKIVKIERDNYNNYDCYTTDKTERLYIEDIVKHSENLIDLIKVGDFVNKERIVDKTGDYIKTENSIHNVFYLRKHIKTILTHEQYEQNCYNVGEN